VLQVNIPKQYSVTAGKYHVNSTLRKVTIEPQLPQKLSIGQKTLYSV
jgi:hypothetical protein